MRLFDPIVEESHQHPNFRNLLRPGNAFALDVLNDWARGFVDRDGKFVAEFQKSFNPCYWELYLFAVLKQYGMQVEFSMSRPDFFLPALNFNIEATVASHPVGGEPEHAPLRDLPPRDLNAFNLKTIIRLSNSLSAKHRKYLSSYATLEHVKNRPFVIAVTNFRSALQLPRRSTPHRSRVVWLLCRRRTLHCGWPSRREITRRGITAGLQK